ncbi:RSP_7527 family protein [Marinomonas profundimaris]|jgi:hypothetical protein|uniref:Uncharacterized protein n=1 Tax=Marinomonas profundimaris TaxID=1208321 RepID=W1S2P3_9GAMM|nr:hypothetical protein [Marinomonas profundimaris]ETI62269.1 hypothetical protein D104_00495 [Marinomonas profundimaris]
MKKNQTIAELLANVNSAYLTDAEKYEAIARAERAEYIVEGISSAFKAIKKAALKLKAAFVPTSAQHA